MSHTEYIWNSAGRSFMCGPNKPQRWWCSANTLSKEKQHATITWDPIPIPVFKQPDDQIHCWSLGASPLGCVWLGDVVLALCGPVPFIAAPLCNHCVPFWSFIVPLQLLHLSFWPFLSLWSIYIPMFSLYSILWSVRVFHQQERKHDLLMVSVGLPLVVYCLFAAALFCILAAFSCLCGLLNWALTSNKIVPELPDALDPKGIHFKCSSVLCLCAGNDLSV